MRHIHKNDIEGVGQCRHHNQQAAEFADGRTLLGLHEQEQAAGHDNKTYRNRYPEALVEKEYHHYRHHNGIDEEECGRDTRVHVLIALEERE